MPDVIPVKTTLLDAINTGLSALGETPVSAPNNASTNVVLAKQIIEEISRDVQSKGWWFNTAPAGISILSNPSPNTSTEDFNSGLPEEARRYISIRASRILQSRFLGSEDLYKFSMLEEQVSFAVLTQAHVRNGGGGTSFTSFPAELKAMGIEEFMFLQGNAEEKLLTIRIATERNTAAKLAAETLLIGSQENLVDQQVITETQTAIKTAAESGLITAQQALVSQQVLEAVAGIGKTVAETSLVGAQELLVDNQTATELKTALKTAAETTLVGSQSALVVNQTATELKTALKTTAETTLVGSQSDLVVNQTATELKTALKTTAEAALLDAQELLVDNQTATELTTATKQTAEAALLDAQELLVDKQALTEAKTTVKTQNEANVFDAQYRDLLNKTAVDSAVEKSYYEGVVAGTQDTYRDYAAEMRMMGVQEGAFQQLLAYKKIELLKDAVKLRTVTATEAGSAAELTEVNKIMRFIGEPPVATLDAHSLASEAVRLLRDTDTELQGRGWWFNTETDVELTVVNHVIELSADILYVEVDGVATFIKELQGVRYLYDIKKKSHTAWPSKVQAKIIYQRDIVDLPDKFQEYLNVRVALVLTELYPQSGIDIQRLAKMEAELRIYFKDRDFDSANYTVFDNYDTASRIGINRNYNLF